MPAFLEKKLKKEYGAKSDIPYKIMNKLGVMHGNKETAKGRKAEARHKALLEAMDRTHGTKYKQFISKHYIK